jgi:hypothetical protein
MAIYRQIQTTFWSDTFVTELTPEQKYFYIYLLTNDKTKQCGIYEITLRAMSFDTGYNVETVEKLLLTFESHKKIKWSKTTNEIALINWAKYNNHKSPKVQSCINKELHSVKNIALIEIMGYDPPEGQIISHNFRVSDTKRAFIFQRDSYKCKKCDSPNDLTVDHIYPVSLGGKSLDQNLRTLCRSCNSSRPLGGPSLRAEIEYCGYNFEELEKLAIKIPYQYGIGSQSQQEEEQEQEEKEEQTKKADYNPETDIIYYLYPSECPIKGNSTNKGSKNKEKIRKIIKEKGFDWLHQRVTAYLVDCKKNKVWLKNFTTFLNNIPDLPEIEKPIESDMVLFRWKHDPTGIERKVKKADAENYFESQALGGYIAELL